MGSRRTFLPVASSKVNVTGILFDHVRSRPDIEGKMQRKEKLPSTLTGHVRLDTKHLLHGLAGGREIPVLGAGNPPFAVML